MEFKGVGEGSSNLFFQNLFYCLFRWSRSWAVQNFSRDRKILFQSEDIKISRSRLSYVNITKTSNKSEYLKISFFDFKMLLVPQFSSKCLETCLGYSVGLPYYMKSIRHIYRTHDYRTTCNSYELLLRKIQNLGQILIPLKF